jgi:hypothetical protein
MTGAERSIVAETGISWGKRQNFRLNGNFRIPAVPQILLKACGSSRLAMLIHSRRVAITWACKKRCFCNYRAPQS